MYKDAGKTTVVEKVISNGYCGPISYELLLLDSKSKKYLNIAEHKYKGIQLLDPEFIIFNPYYYSIKVNCTEDLMKCEKYDNKKFEFAIRAFVTSYP